MEHFVFYVIMVAVAWVAFGAGFFLMREWTRLRRASSSPVAVQVPSVGATTIAPAAEVPTVESAAAINSDELREALSQLHALAAGIEKNVDDHTASMNDINADISQCQEHAAVNGMDFVMRTISRIAGANTRLNEQLVLAKTQIEDQSKLLDTQMAAALTDQLTGIANRRAFDQELNRRLKNFQASGTVFSVILLDVDHFKKFNDSYGHQAGDAVLRNVAQVIGNAVRKIGLVARYGGEEFVIVLPHISLAEGQPIGERIRRAIESSCCLFGGQELKVTASLGLATVAIGEKGDSLVRRADEAVYFSKSSGRNGTSYHDGLTCKRVGLTQDAPPVTPANINTQSAEPTQTAAQPTQVIPAPNHAVALLAGSLHKLAGTPESASGTQLLSRFDFLEQLRSHIHAKRWIDAPLTIMIVEIDQFAALSRRGQGDVAIKMTSKQVCAMVRKEDLVAQYGPSKFAVLLPEADAAMTQSPQERICDALAKQLSRMEDVKFELKFGIAEFAAGDDAVRLLKRAEDSLQKSSQDVPNFVAPSGFVTSKLQPDGTASTTSF